MAGTVVCSSWLEYEEKLGTEKLADGGMQIVRHIYTRARGALLIFAMIFSFFLLGLSVPKKFWFCMHGHVSQRSSLRLIRREKCAQVI